MSEQASLWVGPDTEYVIACDGGARGNPGPAALGVSIQRPNGDEVDAIAETIGETTNNVAEYSAVVVGLKRVAEMGGRVVHVRSDSQLLVEQLKGNYKVRKPHLRALHAEVMGLVAGFERVSFEHVRREQNVRADELVNIALDAHA